MKLTLSFIFFSMLIIGCGPTNKDNPTQSGMPADSLANRNYVQLNIKTDYNAPTVGIDSFKLITNNPPAHLEDAKVIIRAKVILPLAMQKHDAALFDSILARNFTFRGENEFFTRKEYIQDRVKGQWMISYVQYENLVLQFFGEISVLTYRNIVKEKDETGKPRTWFFTWADVWIKEGGRWKVEAIHLIESKKSVN